MFVNPPAFKTRRMDHVTYEVFHGLLEGESMWVLALMSGLGTRMRLVHPLTVGRESPKPRGWVIFTSQSQGSNQPPISAVPGKLGPPIGSLSEVRGTGCGPGGSVP